jgi:hypothetical protein
VDDVPSLRIVRDPGAIRAEPIGAVAIRLDDEVTLERVDDAPAAGEASPPEPEPAPKPPVTGPDDAGPDDAAPAAGAGDPHTSQ